MPRRCLENYIFMFHEAPTTIIMKFSYGRRTREFHFVFKFHDETTHCSLSNEFYFLALFFAHCSKHTTWTCVSSVATRKLFPPCGDYFICVGVCFLSKYCKNENCFHLIHLITSSSLLPTLFRCQCTGPAILDVSVSAA